jgi:molybdopterin converting factor subunit 1
MRVTIRIFARLRDLAGVAELEREVPGPATAADAWQLLAAEVPAVAAHGRSVSVAVNARFAKMTTALEDGDEVAFLPPVSGG